MYVIVAEWCVIRVSLFLLICLPKGFLWKQHAPNKDVGLELSYKAFADIICIVHHHWGVVAISIDPLFYSMYRVGVDNHLSAHQLIYRDDVYFRFDIG